MLSKISYDQALQKNSKIFIDVRSPTEHKESTIPGAINIPVFSNKERENIGTIYQKESPARARMRGVEILSPKIPSILKKIKKYKKKFNYVIIFCSRGNLRSESIVRFCDLAGFKVYQLKGGYKAYRHFILNELENYQLKCKLLVIHGFTGVGKTDLLYQLKKQGVNIIDLENLANHRGSAFGGIGLAKPTNQKQFDSLLWERLEEHNENGIIAVEAESKRIGMSVLPDFFLEEMENGVHVLIQSSLKKRIERIYREYASSYQKNRQAFIKSALDSISGVKKYIMGRLGKEGYNKLIKLCKNGELREVVKILLQDYYDPMYKYSQDQLEKFDLIINSDDIEEMAEELLDFID